MPQHIFTENPLLSVAHTARYKKQPRSTIITYKIIPALTALQSFPFNLSKYSYMLVSILRLYISKIKYLYTDTSDLHNLSRNHNKKNIHPTIFKLNTRTPLLLEVSNTLFMEEEYDRSYVNECDIMPDFSMTEIEVQRDNSTSKCYETSMKNNSISKFRIVDTRIEYEPESLLLKRKQTVNNIKVEDNSNAFMTSELDNFFKRLKRNADEIEMGRFDNSVEMCEPMIDDLCLSYENSMQNNSEQDGNNEDVEFPDNFLFNEVVNGKDKRLKCVMFMKLLKMCGDKKMKCVQKGPFEDIQCMQIIS